MKINDIGKELGISLIVGTVPCLLAALESGLEGMTAFIQLIDVTHPTVKYFLALFLIQIAVSALGRFRPKYLGGVQRRFSYLFSVVNGAGASLLSLYRVVTGVTIAIFIAAATHFHETGSELVVLSSAAALMFLVTCCFFSKANEVAISWQR